MLPFVFYKLNNSINQILHRMAIIDDQNFNTILKQNNYIIIQVLPDGHCLIYAISDTNK